MELKEVKNKGIIREGMKGKSIAFLAGCVVGEELYFSSWLSKGLFKMDLRTGKCLPLAGLKNESADRFLHDQVIYFNNEIWVMPTYQGQNIVRINLETLEKLYIPLPEKRIKIQDNTKTILKQYKSCYKPGQPICWLVPLDGRIMLKVDLLQGRVYEVKDQENVIVFREAKNFTDACFVEDRIWMCPFDDRDLVIFDTISGKFHTREWHHGKEKFGLIRHYKDWVVFLSKETFESILLVNKNTYEEKRIRLDIDWVEKSIPMYVTAHIAGPYLFLPPYRAHEYIMVNLETGRVQADESLYNDMYSRGCEMGRYQSAFRYESKLIYSSDMPGWPLMIHDLKDNEVMFANFRVDEDGYSEFLCHLHERGADELLDWLPHNKVIISEEDFSLRLYCILFNGISQEDIYYNRKIGEEIYRLIKEQM